MNKQWHLLPSTLALSMMLSACGSDSDSSAITPDPKPPLRESEIFWPHPNLEVVGKPKDTALNGKVGIKIGDGDAFVLDLKDANLPSTRPEIFANGQHSMFDLLRYLDQLGLVELEWDGTINSDDTVDFTVNGQSDWFFKFNHNSYKLENMDSKQMGLFEKVEYGYDRIDQALLKNGSIVQFLHTPTFTPELAKVRAAERARGSYQQGDTVVVPKVYIHTKMYALNFNPDLTTPDYTFSNVEVTPHNLRLDLYQPDTVTMADVWATIATDDRYSQQLPEDQRKVQMVYWPKLKIGEHKDDLSEVESYAVTQIVGKHEDTLAAWAHFTGEEAHRGDFGNGGGEKCLSASNPDGISEEFCGFFGGQLVHIMSDNRVLRNAPEEMHLFWYDLWNTLDSEESFDDEGNRIKKKWSAKEDHYQYYSDPTNPLPEGFTVPDIDKAIAPLTETHFGWGIADCGQCHSVEQIHMKNDAGERFDMVRPHECAECHASNGAPQGHDMVGRCFWCHQDVPKHRDMSSNGDYLSTKSEVFTDPYSCTTCHKNPQDGITDRAITQDVEMRFGR